MDLFSTDPFSRTFRRTQVYRTALASGLTVAHNASSWHALFLFQGLARQTAYAGRCLAPAAGAAAGAAAGPPGKYVVRNHPLPLTTRQALEVRHNRQTGGGGGGAAGPGA